MKVVFVFTALQKDNVIATAREFSFESYLKPRSRNTIRADIPNTQKSRDFLEKMRNVCTVKVE